MTDNATMLDALTVAMAAEQKAAQFYKEAAQTAQSPRGKNLLEQLASFEEAHYKALDDLRKSMEGGTAPVEYPGSKFDPVPAEVIAEAASKEPKLDEMMAILRLAIEAESDAHARYLRMAESTEEPAARSLLRKLAEEETLHRRILSDEFYQLNNSGGQWVWME